MIGQFLHLRKCGFCEWFTSLQLVFPGPKCSCKSSSQVGISVVFCVIFARNAGAKHRTMNRITDLLASGALCERFYWTGWNVCMVGNMAIIKIKNNKMGPRVPGVPCTRVQGVYRCRRFSLFSAFWPTPLGRLSKIKIKLLFLIIFICVWILYLLEYSVHEYRVNFPKIFIHNSWLGVIKTKVLNNKSPKGFSREIDRRCAIYFFIAIPRYVFNMGRYYSSTVHSLFFQFFCFFWFFGIAIHSCIIRVFPVFFGRSRLFLKVSQLKVIFLVPLEFVHIKPYLYVPATHTSRYLITYIFRTAPDLTFC